MMIVIGEKVIRAFPVHILHCAVIGHILAQQIDELFRFRAYFPKTHGVIKETPFLIMRRQFFRMEIDNGLAHISKIELDAGIIRHHKA